MITFIDVMRDRFGVELVCRTMRAAEVGFRHGPRLSCGEKPSGVREDAVRSVAQRRDSAAARRELWRLRGAENASPPETTGLTRPAGIRPGG